MKGHGPMQGEIKGSRKSRRDYFIPRSVGAAGVMKKNEIFEIYF